MGSSESKPSKPSVNEVLHHLSNKFKASEEFYLHGNMIANIVFNILRSQRNDVDRVIIAGSIGKKTAVGDCSDFDLVVFLNYKEPPFTNVLNEIKNTLAKEPLKDYKFIKQTRMYIAFEVDGYKFDLAPAANYKGWFSNQYDATVNKIAALNHPIRDGYLFSPGLAETAVEFLRGQSSFTHAVIRLGKYWNSTMNNDFYIRGRSLMIELLAINACRTVGINNFYLAFKQFLTDIKNLSQQKIYFQRRSQIPDDILAYRGPIILDPVNIYNNLGHHKNISTDTVKYFEDQAKADLRNLYLWMKDPSEDAEGLESYLFSEPFNVYRDDVDYDFL